MLEGRIERLVVKGGCARRVIHGKLNTSSNNHFSEGSSLYFCPFLLFGTFYPSMTLPADLNCKSKFFCKVFGSKRFIIGWFFSANIPFPGQIVDLQQAKLVPNCCFLRHLVVCRAPPHLSLPMAVF